MQYAIQFVLLSCFRVYNELNGQSLSQLNSCVLVTESEQDLKSADDYKAVIDLESKCCPKLTQYLQTFVMPSPGDFVKKLIAESEDSSPLNSMIPEQGAFHVILNATEDAVLLFHFFFTELYKHLFRKDLPANPKPF